MRSSDVHTRASIHIYPSKHKTNKNIAKQTRMLKEEWDLTKHGSEVVDVAGDCSS